MVMCCVFLLGARAQVSGLQIIALGILHSCESFWECTWSSQRASRGLQLNVARIRSEWQRMVEQNA